MATPRSDIYALGILTYEALTCRRPFVASNLVGYAVAHGMDPVPPLGEPFSSALDDVVQKALAKRPDDRYASALEFSQALRVAAGLGPQPLPMLDDDLRQLDVLVLDRLQRPRQRRRDEIEPAQRARFQRRQFFLIFDPDLWHLPGPPPAQPNRPET